MQLVASRRGRHRGWPRATGVQGAGRLGEALVGYGLGNFLWNAASADSATTGVLEVTVTGRRVDSYRWIPARIQSGVPRVLEGTGRGPRP